VTSATDTSRYGQIYRDNSYTYLSSGGTGNNVQIVSGNYLYFNATNTYTKAGFYVGTNDASGSDYPLHVDHANSYAVHLSGHKVGRYVYAGLGNQNQVALSSSLNQSDVIIKRDVDGGSSWSESGSLLRLEKDVTNVTSESGNYLEWADTTSGVLGVIDASGNVGIGTTAPSQELHVVGAMRLTGALYDVNNQAGSSNQILSTTGSGVDWVDIGTIGVGGTGTTGYVPKWIGSSTLGDSVIFDDGTNVGIGTTGPDVRLQIEDPRTDSTPMVRIFNPLAQSNVGRY
jgi:hypothetical protein